MFSSVSCVFETGVKDFMLLKNNVRNVKGPGQTS